MSDKKPAKPMKIGEQYSIPCIRVKGLDWISQESWLPVIGPLHDDVEFLNFAVEHYHIDFRFVDPTSFANVTSRYANDGQESHLLGLIIGKEQIIEGPTQQQLIFHRPMPVYPICSSEGEKLPFFCALEDAFAEWVIDPTLPICPHRGLPLDGLADDSGIAVCSGHGLAWDMKTGKCIRRFAHFQPEAPTDEVTCQGQD